MIRRKRPTPRRRVAHRATAEEWQDLTLQLLNRCSGYCWWCGKPLHRTGVRHHRQRKRDGGDVLSNLLLVCPGCHNIAPGSIHQEPALAVERGFIVPTWEQPSQFPILITDTRWLLDDEGGRVPA